MLRWPCQVKFSLWYRSFLSGSRSQVSRPAAFDLCLGLESEALGMVGSKPWHWSIFQLLPRSHSSDIPPYWWEDLTDRNISTSTQVGFTVIIDPLAIPWESGQTSTQIALWNLRQGISGILESLWWFGWVHQDSFGWYHHFFDRWGEANARNLWYQLQLRSTKPWYCAIQLNL